MKCSLLTLSTYIDEELSPERRAEVDAHLVGCARCSAGTATLRDEKGRVGQLARVRVPHSSAQLMLEQVGITGATAVAAPERAPAQPPPPASTQQPWQAAASPGPALPWIPRRPDPTPSATEEMIVPAVSADAQPDLPFDGVIAAAAPPEVEAAAADPGEPLGDEWNDDIAWPATMSARGWEADLPPPLEDSVEAWDQPDMASGVPSFQPPAVPVAVHRLHPAPPVRAVPAAGPAAVWSRFRDAVAVRVALARGADAVDASLEISSGPAAPLRDRQIPDAGVVELTGTAARASTLTVDAHQVAPATTEDLPPAVMDRVAPSLRPTPAILPAATAVEPPAPAPEPPALRHRPRWNAFAGSSYARRADDPEDDDVVEALRKQAAVPSRSLGRHSRAVAREQVTLGTRLRHGGAAIAAALRSAGGSAAAGVRSGGASAATALRSGGSAAAGGARRAADSASGSSPDRRVLAAIAGAVVVIAAALLISHTPPMPTPSGATARHTPATAAGGAAPAAPPTAPPGTSAGAPAAPGGAVAGAQTFGSTGTGFQLRQIRYGLHPGDLRVVFDLGALSGSTGSSPRTVVALSDTQTMLITFSGVVPAGSTGSPPPGGVISSVTLVSTKGGTAEYRVRFTRSVSFTGAYLTGPVRFVLDVH